MTTANNPVQRLAELECGDCIGSQKVTLLGIDPPSITNDATCPTCHGTGKEYWQLWRECPGMDDEWEEEDYEVNTDAEPPAAAYVNIGKVTIVKEYPCMKDESCLQCGGTGWVLKPEAEITSAIINIGKSGIWEISFDAGTWSVHWRERHWMSEEERLGKVWRHSNVLPEALAQAILQAREAANEMF